jgi:hypothetical protein
VESRIMNLSLRTQKADSFRFALPPEKQLYSGLLWGVCQEF